MGCNTSCRKKPGPPKKIYNSLHFLRNPLLPKPKYNVNNIRILSTTTYFYYYYLNNFLCGITYYMMYYILFIDSDTANKSLEPRAEAHGQKQSILIQTMMMTN